MFILKKKNPAQVGDSNAHTSEKHDAEVLSGSDTNHACP